MLFTFHLKYPSYFDEEAQTLAQTIGALVGSDNATDRTEECAVEVVHAFFKSVSVSTCDRFGHLVGAAFAICRATPKHAGECKCPTCSLHDALNFLVQDSDRFEAKESEIMEGWGKGWAGLGWPSVNPHMEKLKAEFIPKEFDRLAKDYDKARERDEF